MNLISWLAKSFNNQPDGASGKKITACVVTCTCICFPMILWTISACWSNKWEQLPILLTIIVGFVSSLFAINTWDKKANPKTSNELPKE